MGNQLKLLRFSQCYGIGGGFWEISKGHKPVRYYMAKRIAVSTPPLYHNGFGLVAVCLTTKYFRQIATNPCYVMVAEFYN